jgi:hypothetical protein
MTVSLVSISYFIGLLYCERELPVCLLCNGSFIGIIGFQPNANNHRDLDFSIEYHHEGKVGSLHGRNEYTMR